ncbi:MAG: hypothetical protein U0Z17_06050 [Bacteroidales bacterium]
MKIRYSLNFFTDYGASKSILRKHLKQFKYRYRYCHCESDPGLWTGRAERDSNGVTRMMQKYMAGKWHIIPGNGKSIGNYVYVDMMWLMAICWLWKRADPAKGMYWVAKNLTYDELFRIMAELSGKKYWMLHLPVPVIEFVAGTMLLLAKVTGIPPLIIPGLVRKYYHNWNVSCAKATRELNYQPVGFKTGAALTVEWLKTIR